MNPPPDKEVSKAMKINSGVSAYRFAQAEIARRWKSKNYDNWAEMLGALWRCQDRTVRERAQVADFRHELAKEFGRWVYAVDYSFISVSSRFDFILPHDVIADALKDALSEGVTFQDLRDHLYSLRPDNTGDMGWNRANKARVLSLTKVIRRKTERILEYRVPETMREKVRELLRAANELEGMQK